MTWTTGQTLQNGRYTIEKKLGRGRFCITYLARDKSGNYLVIKAPDEDLLNQLTSYERNSLESKLSDEARKLERCKHPHVVRVIKTFKERQVFCIAMEYVPGDTLASLTQRVLPEKEALNYIRQIGEALIEVHRQGLLHRDIKPANIMLRAGKNEAVLIDFDLAEEFDYPFTSRWRNESFAAIELNSSTRKRRDSTDIYSLAATLYNLLTGEKPPGAIKRKDGTKSLKPPKELNPQISERVNQAILQGMKLEPEARPQTVRKWLSLLEFSIPRLPWKQPSWAVTVEIIVVVATVISAIFTALGYYKPNSPPPSSEVTPTKINNRQSTTND
ncbi:MAG: serine/threonine protein kinase [Symploca sp. SIO2E6]|nr:serine/threonine protein kinase [Symploca sp. SIO2E6]